MDFHLDTLLGLPNITVFSYSSELDFIVLKLQLISDGINCSNCNYYTDTVHQVRPILVRDLSIFGQLVYLKVPGRQFYCPNCKKSPTEPFSWLNKKQRQTTRYQEYIYNRVKELTVKQVSDHEKMSEDTVQDIFHKIARLKKSGCALVGFPDGLAHQARLGNT